MKINFAVGNIEGFGGIKTTSEIASRLSKRGHTITVTLFEPQPTIFDWGGKIIYARTNFQSFKRKSVRLFNKLCGFKNDAYRFYSNQEDMIKVMPDCDINVAQHGGTVFAVYESKKGIPFIHLQHYDAMLFDKNSFVARKFNESMLLPIQRTVNSIWLHKKIKKEYRYNLPIINPGIDHKIFYPRKTKKGSKRKRVVSLGKDLKWKGFHDALRAIKIVRKEYPNLEFIAFGARPLKIKRPETHYKFYHNISDDELATLYSSADVVISPSWYESFPGPPIEAMACGAPVVTTKIGVGDYAINDKNCLVVPPKKPKSMASAILRLLSDEKLKKKFKKNGPKTAKKITWKKTTDKFENIFKKICLKNINK